MPRLTLALLLVLAACADAPPPDPGEPDVTEAAAPSGPVGEGLGLAPADSAALASFFDAAQVEAALAADRRFREATSGADLRAAYDAALALDPVLLGPLAEGYDVWSELDRFMEADLGLPGLEPTCAAECTIPSFTLDVADWQRAAAHVGDPGAVAFFDALGAAYRSTYLVDGRLGGWPAYQEQTWDYGGHSRLGAGAHAALLARLADADGGAFADALDALRADVRQDALTTACVGPTAEEARAELVRIRDEGLLPADADALAARIEAFGEPGPAGIEAGCAEGGCGCEGG